MAKKSKFFSAKNIAILAVLVALVVVLQVFSGFFRIGETSLSFVLIPVVLGGMMLGVGAGALLGGVFGLVVIIDAVAGLDPFTLLLIQAQPVFTIFLCLLKGVAAGVVPALVYKAIAKKNRYVAVFVAAALAPICNTGIFILGGLIMSGTITQLFTSGSGDTVIYFLAITCAGINFVVEFALNIVLAPALYTVETVVEKQILKKYYPETEQKEAAEQEEQEKIHFSEVGQEEN